MLLDLLVTEREAAVAEATRLRNQLHQQLLQLVPDYRSQFPKLTTEAGLHAAEMYTLPNLTAVQIQRLAAVRRLVQRLRLALAQAATIAEEIRSRAARQYLPLTRLTGVQLLTAGT